MGKKLLLHSCCGPCSTACIERLINEYDFDITIYYCNPCITDIDEYNKRKENQIRFINEFNSEEENRDRQITFVEGEYDPENYLESVKGLEKEPEGGKRCTVCFNQRLSHAADYAKENGFKIFTTTLTVSPHKNYKLITEIGKNLAFSRGIDYLNIDFKKKNGFLRSTQISKEHGLYRQNFCGCEFSRRD